MKRILILSSLLAIPTLLACGTQERELDGYSEDLEYFDESGGRAYGNIDAQDGRIIGDFGSLRGVDAPATVSGYDEGNYATIEVLTENQSGSAMHYIEINGGINHPALRPGAELRFAGDDYPIDDSQLYMTAVACSGQSAYAWDYDEGSDELTATVSETEDPDVVRIDYTSEVRNDREFGFNDVEVSSGSFLLRR